MAVVRTGYWLDGWGGGRLFCWRCIAACTVVAVLSGNVSLMLGGLTRC